MLKSASILNHSARSSNESSMECGGIDTALACPLAAKAASRPPHSTKWRIFALGYLGAVLAITLLATQARAGNGAETKPSSLFVDTPKVLAGDYIDTSSMETIVAGLFKSKAAANWTDEQKVLNFYHWYRRLVYPFRYMAEDRRDVLKAINSAGFSLCGSQAAVTTAILRAAGYPTRIVQVDAGGEWGHTVWEVKYDDTWHLFDAMTAFYVMTRDNPPHVAGVEEIQADPTLVTKAVEEKRCGPEFVYTARDHEITLPMRAQFEDEVGKADVPWSILTTKKGSMIDFWNKAATKNRLSPGKEGDAYGAAYTPGVLDIKLKANERYVRSWQNCGLWNVPASFAKWSPANMAAGDNEKFDTVNFKYFEPYRQENPSPYNKAVCRTYGNGYLEWEPRTDEEFLQGGRTEDFTPFGLSCMARPKFTSAEEREKTASIIIPVKSPYAVVQIETKFRFVALPDGLVTLSLTPMKNGRPGSPKKLWTSDKGPTSAPDSPKVNVEQNEGNYAFVISLLNTPAPVYEYELRLDLRKCPNTELLFGGLTTTFQLNPMSLPGLVPGDNAIRVTAAQPGKLAGGKLLVTYNWLDAPDWKAAKTDMHEVREFPTEYTIKLPPAPADKLPKMQSVELFLKAD